MARTQYEDAVPARLIGQDPDDGTMIDVTFEWSPGSPASGLYSLPEHYDPGSADEFDIVSPEGLSDEHAEAVIEWLDEHWDRPEGDDEPDPDWLRDQRFDDELTDRT